MLNKLLIICLLWTPLFAVEKNLTELLNGNARYVKGRTGPMSQTQKPFAVIVACADSRVAPEIIFDQGQGALFVVRVAGNVVGDLDMESINFAIDQLGVKLIMVLGHESCGAVEAVRTGNTSDIPAIADLIAPSIKGTDTLAAAIKANAVGVAHYIEKFYPKLRIVAGYYDFDSGKVEILNN